jgi:hypothetical protein
MRHADKLIIKIQRKKYTASTVITIIGIIIVTGILIEQIIEYLEGNQIDIFTLPIGMLIIMNGIQRIIMQKQSVGIGQDGVSLEIGRNITSFYKWNEILSYEWISSNEIQFKIQITGKKVIDRYLKMQDHEKNYIDEILKEHINS